MDTVAGFIEDECHQGPSLRSSLASLYDQYASWCKAQDKHPRTKVQFGNALKSQGFAQVRDSTGRHWRGLSIHYLTRLKQIQFDKDGLQEIDSVIAEYDAAVLLTGLWVRNETL